MELEVAKSSSGCRWTQGSAGLGGGHSRPWPSSGRPWHTLEHSSWPACLMVAWPAGPPHVLMPGRHPPNSQAQRPPQVLLTTVTGELPGWAPPLQSAASPGQPGIALSTWLSEPEIGERAGTSRLSWGPSAPLVLQLQWPPGLPHPPHWQSQKSGLKNCPSGLPWWCSG